MTELLPERPDLGQLKKQAKDLLKEVRAGRPGTLARIGGDDPSRFALHDAQRVVARTHGFPSWARLKAHLETMDADAAEAALVQAALKGDEARAADLLRIHPGLAERSIHSAAALGNEAAVRSWIERDGALARTKEARGGLEPLMLVCFGRLGGGDGPRAAAAGALIALGADPNSWRGDPAWPKARETALYGAAGVNNYPRLARVLLAAGANPTDGESRYHAPEHNHVESLEIMAEFGTDFSSVDPEWGNTPLYFLLGWQSPPPEVTAGIRWLLGHGADPNIPAYVHRARETPLHLAVRNNWDAAMVELLLSHGADPAITRADGRTPYALAVRGARDDIATLLGGRGGRSEVASVDLFLGACMRGDEEAARGMIAREPELLANLTDGENLVVHEAAKRDRVDALRLMVALGLDPKVKDDAGVTALHVAGWHGRAGAMRFLVGQGLALDDCESHFGAPPIGWVAHGSLNLRNPDGDYGDAAAALVDAGAKVPEGTHGSAEVMEAIRRKGGG